MDQSASAGRCLHLATGRTLAASLGSMEWSQVTGPVINGEFGTERRWFGNDVQQARPLPRPQFRCGRLADLVTIEDVVLGS